MTDRRPDPEDLEPAGYAISVAFAGAVVGAAGAIGWLIGGSWGVVVLSLGAAILLLAPVVWIGLRRGMLRVPDADR